MRRAVAKVQETLDAAVNPVRLTEKDVRDAAEKAIEEVRADIWANGYSDKNSALVGKQNGTSKEIRKAAQEQVAKLEKQTA